MASVVRMNKEWYGFKNDVNQSEPASSVKVSKFDKVTKVANFEKLYLLLHHFHQDWY